MMVRKQRLSGERSWRTRYSAQRLLAELLDKRWMEPAFPTFILLVLVVVFSQIAGGFTSGYNLDLLSRSLAEFALVALAMGIVVISGGVDLSVGSSLSFTTMFCLILLKVTGLPASAAIPLTLLFGALLGGVNGFLVGFVKARPFVITLVTFLVYRGIVEVLDLRFTESLSGPAPDNVLWAGLGAGALAAVPSGLVLTILVYLAVHIMLSRSRFGWHVIAVGSSRRAARHAGIRVERTLFMTYTLSGVLVAASGVLTAARLDSASSRTGDGLEIAALTAVVLGGISLSGGRGTALRALLGSAIISVLGQGLILMDLPGDVYSTILASMLVLVVGIDVKWSKNRAKAIQKIRISPTRVAMGELPDTSRKSGGALAQNDRLTGAQAIGLGIVEGPEDVIVGKDGTVYCDDRRGRILKFWGPNFEHHDVFAQTGGGPYGMAFDAADNLIVCVAGIGLYSISPQGEMTLLADEVPRSWRRLSDDSRIRLADDVDVVPDGRIYFSEATTRFELPEWILDSIEGRPNGRLICYDPRSGKAHTAIDDIVFANGVCSCHDGESLLLASTWLCKIFRYWHSGPRQGDLETFVDNLPGYVDNINRASDGSYWVALNGLRSPTFDLAMQMPEFRRLMIKQIPADEWLYPSLNHGCIVKVSAQGKVTESLWDPTTEWHPSTTSMREFDGHLYVGGLHNNRVGVVPLPPQITRCQCGQMPCEKPAGSDAAAVTRRDGRGIRQLPVTTPGKRGS